MYCSTWLVANWQAYIIFWPKRKKISIPGYLKLAYRNTLLENLWQLANFYTYSVGKGYLVLPALYMKWMWISKMEVLISATSVPSDWAAFIAFDRFDSHPLWILWSILTLYMSFRHKSIHSAHTRNTVLPWLISYKIRKDALSRSKQRKINLMGMLTFLKLFRSGLAIFFICLLA